MGEWFSGIAPGDLLKRLRRRRDNASREDLEDAIQDVMLHALETARRRAPPGTPENPEAYLVRSVHNRLNSMQRALWREVPGGIQPGDEPADSDDPERLHEARERAALFAMLAAVIRGRPNVADGSRLTAAFAMLQERLAREMTDRHWILLRLRVLEGLGYADCAGALGVSLGTAHSWTRAALAIVREALIDCGIDAGRLAEDPDGGAP